MGGKGTPFTLPVMGRWPPALLGIQRHKNGRPTWLENDLDIGLQAQAEAPAARVEPADPSAWIALISRSAHAREQTERVLVGSFLLFFFN